MSNGHAHTSAALSVHHVGGRDGSRTFPIIPQFEGDIINVIYDADADCVGQIRQRNEPLASRCLVLPYCLGGTTGSAEFKINFDPYTSSLLEACSKYGEFCTFHQGTDYILGESLKPMERRSVDTITFDDLFRGDRIAAPPPDFLSLDTQGSEYEILCGAKELLDDSIVAVSAEVEFQPIYQGQKLFGDVSSLLTEHGFHFIDFLTEGPARFSPIRLPVGLRSKGFLISSNALFLRKADVLAQDPDVSRRRRKLCKVAFFSIVFGQFEYGIDCLQRASLAEWGGSAVDELSVRSYYRFLLELSSIISDARLSCPPTFAEEALRRRPVLWNLARLAHDRTAPVRLAATRMLRVDKRLRLSAPDYPLWGYSRVESLLVRYGLRQPARELRASRRVQELHTVGTSNQSTT